MLPQPARRNVRRAGSVLAVLAGLAVTLSSSSCDKVPLLAPTGSVITLFATAATVPSNGSMEIVATVIEQGTASTTAPPANGGAGTGTGTTATSTPGAGTPVHNGTVVTFTTTIGRVEPSEARTSNGQVRVRFHADGQSGTAVITAFSGGASGKLENLRVGSAGAERILLSANPQALACSGGSSQVSARVEDVSGVGLPEIPVVFTTTRGQLTPSTATTDASGWRHYAGDQPGSDCYCQRCRQDRHRDSDHQPEDRHQHHAANGQHFGRCAHRALPWRSLALPTSITSS